MVTNNIICFNQVAVSLSAYLSDDDIFSKYIKIIYLGN